MKVQVKKLILSVFLLVLCQEVFGIETIRENRIKMIKKIESNYQKLIKKEKISVDRRYLIYLDAARELYSFYFYQRAEKYINKALKLNTHHDLTEAYSLKTSIYRIQHPLKLKKVFSDWSAYNKKYPFIAKSNEIREEYLYLLNKFDPKKMTKQQKEVFSGSQLAKL